MRNKVSIFLGRQMIFNKTNSFYRMFILNGFFTIFLIPWLIVNSILQFTQETYFIYLIVGVWVFPNIQTLFYCIKLLINEERLVSFKEYLNNLKGNLKSGLIVGTVGMLVISFILFELMIVFNNSELLFFFPVFFLFILFFSASLLNVLFLNAREISELKNKIKMSLFIGWRSVVKSIVCSCLLLLWLSLGYFIPLFNVMIGNVLIWGLIYKVINKNVNKFMAE